MQGPRRRRAPRLETPHHLSPNRLSQQWNRWAWDCSGSARWVAAVARRLIEEWELLGERAGATPVLRCVAVRDIATPATSI